MSATVDDATHQVCIFHELLHFGLHKFNKFGNKLIRGRRSIRQDQDLRTSDGVMYHLLKLSLLQITAIVRVINVIRVVGRHLGNRNVDIIVHLFEVTNLKVLILKKEIKTN